MEHIKLSAQSRTVTGKAVRRLRRDGIIPVVVYGGGLDGAISLQVNARELQRVLHAAGGARVIDLQTDGQSYPVLAREVNRDPIRHDVRHVDFLAVRLDQPIEADVPIVVVGESALVENKVAILMHPADTLTVRALPDNLPAQIEVDISGLTEVGQQLLAAELALPAEVTLVTDGDTLIVSLAAPALTIEEEEAAEAEERVAGEADEVALEDEETTDEDDNG